VPERTPRHVHALDVEARPPDALHRIAVKQDRALACQPSDGLDRLNRPDLVVHEHHAHENRPVRDGRRNRIDLDDAVRPRRHVGHREPLTLEVPARIEHCFMLDGGRDDVAAALRVAFSDALDR
jgi:hypothetical protein